MDYQPAKVQCCRLSLASFIGKLRKHNNDIIMLLEFQKLKFCETGYRLSSLQVSNLLVVLIEFYGG